MKKEYMIFGLRIALGLAFLSAVADRFGFYGGSGSPNVVWGNFDAFIQYTALLNSFLPQSFAPFLGWSATLLEILFGICLIIGFQIRKVSFLSGILLSLFALTMILSFGFKPVFDYSVLTAMFASFVLSFETNFIFSINSGEIK